ncbi:MAG: two-component system response regulator [Desulfobacterales bacterium]|nr:MAG: two-component system response regulator [Desulfobacterales bacterium]
MQPATIMIIDDTPENLHVLSTLLQRSNYKTSVFPRGRMGFAAARKKPPHLVLLDINMPEMDGFEVCQAFKDDPQLKEIPIIFISALGSTEDKVKALKLGGVDYITKPFQAEEVYARVDTHLQLYHAKNVLQDFNTQLNQKVREQIEEINQAQIATIFALAKLSHTRDDDTGFHLERVQHFCKLLATEIQNQGLYPNEVDDTFINSIFHASPLHDLGKVGIEDTILLKPGKLTAEEFEIMKTHTLIGAATLESVQSRYPNSAFIKMGIEIARHHHEKWDGTGYPDKLAGGDIPLSARIMSIADVYDALRSKRPYKAPYSHEKSKKIIIENSGTLFDPQLIDVFKSINAQFAETFLSLADE